MSTTMKPGLYYVGDTCYMLGHRWDEMCSLFISGDGVLEGAFNTQDGHRFCIFSTMWGDGVYYDQQGRKYLVDAGSIGAVPVEMINPKLLTEEQPVEGKEYNGGHIIQFDETFQISGTNRANRDNWRRNRESDAGVIKIGHIHIDTDPSEEEEEEVPKMLFK